MSYNKQNYNKLLIRLTLLVVIVLPFTFILPHNIVQSFTDFFVVGAKTGLNSFYTWNESNFGTSTAGELWRLFPLSFIFYFLNNILHLPGGVAQFIILSSLYIIGFTAFIKLCRYFTKDRTSNPTPSYIAGLLYLFNPYSMVQVSNSFLLVTPYLLLPLQILLLIRGLEAKRSGKYIVLLALLNASIYGINLIFAVISLAVTLLIGLWNIKVNKNVSMSRFVKVFALSTLLTLGLTSYWILPQIYGSLSDLDTSAYVLQSEDFYNLDSSITNVLKGLGDWAFFGSNNNIPYLAYSNTYKTNVPVIFAGYLLIAIALCPLAIRNFKPKTDNNSWHVFFYILLFLVIPFIGGTHEGWLTTGIMKWLFTNVPYFMAFRNTYKFASLEFLALAVLIAFAMTQFFKSKPAKRYKVVGSLFVLTLILINAFPYFTGQLFSKNQSIDKIPAYWHESAKFINKSTPSFANIFTLPNQYFEVFDWGDGLKSFPRNLEETLYNRSVVHNTCRGCATPRNATFLTYAYGNLENPKVYPLLGLVGISHILQRNDYASTYYKVETPIQIKNALRNSPIVRTTKSFGKLDLYALNPANVFSRFYSPAHLYETGKIAEMVDVLNIYSPTKDTAGLILSPQIKKSVLTKQHASLYKRLFDIDETKLEAQYATNFFNTSNGGLFNISTANAKANTSLNYQLSYESMNGALHLYLKPITNKISVDGVSIFDNSTVSNDIIDIDLGNYSYDIAIKLSNQAFLLKPNSKKELGTIKLQPGNQSVEAYSAYQEDLTDDAINGSLDQGLWQTNVIDCQKKQEKAEIGMKLVPGATVGTKALQLSAKQDTACTFTPNLTNFKSGIYLYTFDYRNSLGGTPSFCAWDGKGCVEYADVDVSKTWQTYSNVAFFDKQASNFNLYFYAQKGNYPQTVNLYDNVKMFYLASPIKRLGFSTSQTKAPSTDIALNAGAHTAKVTTNANLTNLLPNGSFESGLWSPTVSNCSGDGVDNSINMSQASDNTKGKKSLELASTGATACTSSDNIKSFKRDDIYSVDFAYKVVEDDAARICVWDGTRCLVDKTLTTSDHNWHTYRGIVQPTSTSKNINVYFYAVRSKNDARVRYDDVHINKINNNFLDTYVVQSKTPLKIHKGEVSEVVKMNPTTYTLKYRSKGLSSIIFQEAYNPNWKLYILPNEAKSDMLSYKFQQGNRLNISEVDHYVANGLMNGWWIDTSKIPSNYLQKDGTLRLQAVFSTQQLVYKGLLISSTVLLGCIIFLIFSSKKIK